MNAPSLAALSGWEARSHRERVLLALLAVIVLALGVWYGAAAPLLRAAHDAQSHRLSATEQFIATEAAAATLASHKAGAAASLADLVQQTAGSAGLIIAAPRPENAREVTITARGASSVALFAFIRALQDDYAVVITNLAATRDDQGALQVEMRLARSGR